MAGPPQHATTTGRPSSSARAEATSFFALNRAAPLDILTLRLFSSLPFPTVLLQRSEPPTWILHPRSAPCPAQSIHPGAASSPAMARTKKLMTGVYRALRRLYRACGAQVQPTRRSSRLANKARVRYYAPSRPEATTDTVVHGRLNALKSVQCEVEFLKIVPDHQFKRVNEVASTTIVRVNAAVKACKNINDLPVDHGMVQGLKVSVNQILCEASAELTELAQSIAAGLKAAGFKFM